MKEMSSPRIIARYGDKVIGWVGSEKKCRLYGDKEWVQVATMASIANMDFTLYEDIALVADIDNHLNPAGAFAAMAWYAKERIEIVEAPDGMMESLGLLPVPKELHGLEDSDIADDEDIAFHETHLTLYYQGQKTSLPLSTLMIPEGIALSRLKELLSTKS